MLCLFAKLLILTWDLRYSWRKKGQQNYGVWFYITLFITYITLCRVSFHALSAPNYRNWTMQLQFFFRKFLFQLEIDLVMWILTERSLCEKCPNTELFLVRIFLYIPPVSVHIQAEYRKIRTKNNSVFGHFPHSGCAELLPSHKFPDAGPDF